MRDVAIIGCGMTKFGRHDNETLMDLLVESSLQAIDDCGSFDGDIDCIYVSSMLAGELNRQTVIATALADQLALIPAAADRIENGPASGGSAIKTGFMAVASGMYDVVLVTGGEKMRHVTGDRITDLVATMTHPSGEYIHGVTLPSLAAMFARLYMSTYGVTSEDLARVAVKNHSNALMNPYAHIHSKIALEGILLSKEAEINNPVIADPLRLYDLCPVSDGAASIVMCNYERVKKLSKPIVRIAGCGQATDNFAVHEREDPTMLKAVKEASKKAFQMAGLAPGDIDVAELHDAFTVLEIAESEDAGFFEKGKGHIALRNGETSLGGRLPINTSGGLKARGHPVGATGVSQVVELTWQLRGEADERQVKNAKNAFCCNFGGFGSNVTALVLSGE